MGFKRKARQYSGLQILFGPKYWLWRYDTRQLMYVTPNIPRIQMTKYAQALYKQKISDRENLILWDMFGGIGTDAIFFSNYFNVIATELDAGVYDLLKQNIKIQGCNNVLAIHSNCLKLISVVNPDIIYFDPPWGAHYNSQATDFNFETVTIKLLPEILELELYPQVQKAAQVKTTDIVSYLLENVTSHVIIKSPFNCQTFEKLFGDRIEYVYKYPKKNLKFLFLSK